MRKDVKGYEGLYAVDKLGNVYSTPSDGKPNRILKVDVNNRNHSRQCRVTLCKNGKTKRFLVHRLIADAFLPNTENKPFINHIDNDAENNNVNNLEWCTQKENIQHAVKQKRMKGSYHIQQAWVKRSSNAKARRDEMIGEIFDNRKLIRFTEVSQHSKVIFECMNCGNIYETHFTKKVRRKSGTCCKCPKL